MCDIRHKRKGNSMAKVILFGTGNAGKAAIAAIAGRSDIELAGVRVWDPEKEGVDAGTIAGIDPIGVAATTDEAALLALDADCVLWMGAIPTEPDMGVGGLCEILASGKDLISLIHAPFMHAATCPPELRDPLLAACEAGNSTFHFTGIDPGFIAEAQGLLASSLCSRIDRITTREILDYSGYDSPQMIFDVMQFGAPSVEYVLGFVGAMTPFQAPALHLVADGLGATIENITHDAEVVFADEDFTVAAGTIKKGTVAGMRFWWDAIVDGQPLLRIEHVSRLQPDQGPEWAQGQGYTVTIDGEPPIEVRLTKGFGDRNDVEDAVICAAARAVNAVPAVTAAPSGVASFLTLPLDRGRYEHS